MSNISKSSTARISRFIDAFIRSERMQAFTAERNSDFINEPERAGRIADEFDAYEYGSETHAETIQDWRDAFSDMLRERDWEHAVDRFAGAVYAHFDAVEEWHAKAGTLHQCAM